MSTVTISLRLPRSEVGRLEKLARELGTERPAFLKRALQRGAADLMFERACQAYRDGEATLTRAAEIAGLSLREMMHRMRNADLELNYGVDDLAKDLHT
jgi:predicted HTH domain antitoxin